MDSITIEVAKENKFICLVGPHPIGVICPDKNKILVGRGSIGLLNNVHYYHQKIQEQPVLQIGNFCESSVDCTILVGGEHDNHSAWNLVYAGLPVMAQLATSSIGHPLALSKGSTSIESNVVLSKGCLVVSGSRIGTGAVIAANAVVAGNVPPKTIWIGNPGCGRPRFGKRTEEEIYDLIDWNRLCVGDVLDLESWVRSADREALKRYFDAQEPEPNRRL